MFPLSPGDRQALTTFLQDLVRTPSPSTQEEAVARRLAQEMHRVGIAEVRVDRIGNVIGRIGPGRGKVPGRRPALLFNGHMDTVGVGDPAAWEHDPFGGEIEAGLLHGRGAADMKGALAAMVYGAKLLLDHDVPLGGDLYVVGVVQEEPREGMAMRVLVEEEGLRPDWVVLGEPSDLQVKRGHPGRMEVAVTVRGVACHAAAPWRGENAIYRAARLVVGLEALANELHIGRERGTLAVTLIESTAGSRNAVPDRCTLTVDRRLALGETRERALAEVGEVVERAEVPAQVTVPAYEGVSYTGYRCEQEAYYPAWEIPADHPLVQAAADAAHKVLGRRPEIGRWDFSTDGAYTQGIAGIPTVGFGPGEERYAHTSEEQIRLEDVASAAQVYAELAVALLGADL